MPFNTQGQANALQKQAAAQKKRNALLFTKKMKSIPPVQSMKSTSTTRRRRAPKARGVNLAILIAKLMILLFKLKLDPAAMVKRNKNHKQRINDLARNDLSQWSAFVPPSKMVSSYKPGAVLNVASELVENVCPATEYNQNILQPKCQDPKLESYAVEWAKLTKVAVARLPNKDPKNNVCREPGSFCKDGLGIPRILMPDLKNPDDFLQRIHRQFGIENKRETVKMNDLKPAQGEIRRTRVNNAAKEMNTNGVVKIKQNNGSVKVAAPIIISQDNFIVDGHHRWAAAHDKGLEDKDIPVIRILAPISEILLAAAVEPSNPF